MPDVGGDSDDIDVGGGCDDSEGTVTELNELGGSLVGRELPLVPLVLLPLVPLELLPLVPELLDAEEELLDADELEELDDEDEDKDDELDPLELLLLDALKSHNG